MSKQNSKKRPCHAELGRYISRRRVDRGRFGLWRYRRGVHRDRQDHLLYRRGAVPDLGRGWSGPRTQQRLVYFEGIAILRPKPSGRATAAWAFATVSMRARMSGGKGAAFRAAMST